MQLRCVQVWPGRVDKTQVHDRVRKAGVQKPGRGPATGFAGLPLANAEFVVAQVFAIPDQFTGSIERRGVFALGEGFVRTDLHERTGSDAFPCCKGGV